MARRPHARQRQSGSPSTAIDEHLLSVDEVAARYGVHVDAAKPMQSAGLSEDEAGSRLAANGPNALTPPKQKSWLVQYLECLISLFSMLLIIASILTFVMYGIDRIGNASNLYVGPILMGVAFLNAFIEFYQHQKSASIMSSFMNMIPAKCTVVRDAQLRSIPAANLVVGDVVLIKMGDKVPADVFLFSCVDVKVDNSSLTGESEPQERSVTNAHHNPLEASNLAFNGSLMVSGQAYGIVIRTGDNTMLGQIANMTGSEQRRTSPLTSEINTFVYLIGTIALITAVIFFGVAVAQGRGFGPAFNFAVGVLTAWVPQGLPATVTMLLTIAAKRMAKQNVLVKDLPGVETLGAVTLLATDKTGTLTRNQMTAATIWTQGQMYAVLSSATGMANDGGPALLPFDLSVEGILDILNISAVCSKATFDRTDVPIYQRAIFGDATESGLFRLAAQRLPDFDTLPSRLPKVFEVPFNSTTKTHTSVHDTLNFSGDLLMYVKGAPERVLRLCDHMLGPDGVPEPLTQEHREAFQAAYERMASQGHRVLAFAKRELPSKAFPRDAPFTADTLALAQQSGVVFVGLASLEDPPKHGVREAIGHCRRAGIKVVMVTGDHPLTAEAIARKINLMTMDTRERVARRMGVDESEVNDDEVKAVVIHGERLDSLTDDEWDRILAKDEIIFARTSPKHKLQIVKRTQSLGHIVAVTGDGVNDSPALKKADLGIAMNMSGSDASKEAAVMILLDDNFASIMNGIREGRLIFINLKKSIKYVITHSIPEVVTQLLYVVVPLPLALATLQILVIDLGFELFAALSYAFEPPESEGLMQLRPRKPVTVKSIARRRARNAFDARLQARYDSEASGIASGVDEESRLQSDIDIGHPAEDNSHNLQAKPTTRGGLLAPGPRIRKFASATYWRKHAFVREPGEVLVDGEVLSWAYLEGGVIEFLGGYLTFFVVFYTYHNPHTHEHFWITPHDVYTCTKSGGWLTNLSGNIQGPSCILGSGTELSPADQREALSQAQAAMYLSIMILQMWNLFICKARLRAPFGWHMLRNRYTWFSILGGAAFAFGLAYIPGINKAFGMSGHLNPVYLLIPLGWGGIMFLYSTLRFVIKSRLRPLAYAPVVNDLAMYPTRYTTKSGKTMRG